MKYSKLPFVIVAIAMLLRPLSMCVAQDSFNFDDSALGAFQGSHIVSNGLFDLELSTPTLSTGYLFIDDGSSIGDFPFELGAQSLLAFAGEVPAFGESLSIRHAFSVDITEAVFVFGDIGGDDDGMAFLELFDSGGNSIDILSQPVGTFDGVLEFRIDQTFRSAVFSSNGNIGPNSLAQEWQGITAVPELLSPTAVPEPLSPAVSLFVVIGVTMLRRRA